MPISFNLLTVQEVHIVIDWTTTVLTVLLAAGIYIAYHRLYDSRPATTTFTTDQSEQTPNPAPPTPPEDYFRRRLDFRRVVRRYPRVPEPSTGTRRSR